MAVPEDCETIFLHGLKRKFGEIHRSNLFSDVGFVDGWVSGMVGQCSGGCSVLVVQVPGLAIWVGSRTPIRNVSIINVHEIDLDTPGELPRKTSEDAGDREAVLQRRRIVGCVCGRQ